MEYQHIETRTDKTEKDFVEPEFLKLLEALIQIKCKLKERKFIMKRLTFLSYRSVDQLGICSWLIHSTASSAAASV